MKNQRQNPYEENEQLLKFVPVNEMDNDFKRSTTNRYNSFIPRIAATFAVAAISAYLAFVFKNPLIVVLGLAISLLLYVSMHIILEWEQAVILRLGKLSRVAGPGLVFTIPFAENVASIIDMRIRSTAFKAEHVLTSDLVPVNVDAVLFWMVHDTRMASTEVRNFERLVFWVAQTTLRDVMGSIEISQLSTRRTQIDAEIQKILAEKTGELGISVTNVEIRDIEIPEDLQEALSAEARARQEYNARIILAEVESEVSDLFVEAARTYKQENGALQLRAMNCVSEGIRQKGSMVVVPSAIAHVFENAEKLASEDLGAVR